MMVVPTVARPVALVAFLSSVISSHAATVQYDFDIGWVTANPDGMADRPTIGINGQWPIPKIEATVGDRVIVNVLNSLGNQSTSLHFHGLFMNGTTHMDGPSQVTQCAIPPGSRFTYDFTASLAPHFMSTQTNSIRLTNQGHTGITPIRWASIQMASGDLS